MRTLESILSFTLGLACGAAVTLVLTPRSGEDSRRLLAEKGIEGLELVVGEENLEKAQAIYERGGEAVEVARDSFDLKQRTRRLSRPLGED